MKNSKIYKVAGLSLLGFVAVSIGVEKANVGPLTSQLAGFCGAFAGALVAQARSRIAPEDDASEAPEPEDLPAQASTMNLVCQAILFDMDGTLVDSTAVVEQAWKWWAQRHDLPLPELLAFAHGRPTLSTMQRFRPSLSSDSDLLREAAEMDRIEEAHAAGIVPVPGAHAAVQAAQLGLWAVVTSAPRQLAADRLRAANLPVPRILVPADEIENGKPHPEGFLKAAELLGVAPEACVVFEDTRPGIAAAQAAGMTPVGLLTTFPKEQLGCDLVIRDFTGIHIERQENQFSIAFHTHPALTPL